LDFCRVEMGMGQGRTNIDRLRGLAKFFLFHVDARGGEQGKNETN